MLERELGVELPESQDLSTVAGLLMERLGHVPKVGDEIEVADHRAQVLNAHQGLRDRSGQSRRCASRNDQAFCQSFRPSRRLSSMNEGNARKRWI